MGNGTFFALLGFYRRYSFPVTEAIILVPELPVGVLLRAGLGDLTDLHADALLNSQIAAIDGVIQRLVDELIGIDLHRKDRIVVSGEKGNDGVVGALTCIRAEIYSSGSLQISTHLM